MTQLFICSQGHEWTGDPESSSCPRCGEAADVAEGMYRTVVDELPPAPAEGSDQTLRRALVALPFAPQRPAETGPLPTMPGYEILGVLGRGGMGVVYRARQISLDRIVALKMILTAEHADPEERQRFRAEADAVARLQHPNIVSIYEIGEHADRPYLAFEYIAGGTLADRLKGAPWPAQDSARLTATLARAVAYAHTQHVIHRDLKPGNILLKDEGEATSGEGETARTGTGRAAPTPKIADFGLAKRLDRPAGATQTGAVMGTPSYMAPEQAAGASKQVGPACDVYALGAILYELLTGRPPFRGATAAETLQQVVHDEPVSPLRLQPRVPRDLETICLKCLHKEPARRYAAAAELADDLERFRAGRPIQARPVPWWERTWKWARRRPALAALAVVSLLAAAVLATVMLLYNHWLAEENQRYLDERNTARKAAAEARRQQAKAQAGLRMSMQAVDQFLTRVGETRSLFPPHLEQDRANVFEDALKFCRDFLKENQDDPEVREEVGLTLLRSAKLLRYLRRFAEADKAFLEAIAFWERIEAAFPQHLAETHFQHGHLHRFSQPKRAGESYEKTRALIEPLAAADPGNETAGVLLGYCLHDLAILDHEAGRGEQAEKTYRAALVVRDRVRRAHPTNPAYRLQLAATQGSLGFLLDGLSRLPEAEKYLTDTRDDLRALLKDFSKSAEYASDLGQALINLGNLYSRTERAREAAAAYHEARALFARLHDYQPGNPTYQHRLALALHNLGDLASDEKQFPAAEEYLARSLELNQDLAKRYPHHPPWRRAVAGNYLTLADVCLATERKELAHDKAHAALVLLEKLVHDDPQTISHALDLGKACVFLVTRKAERKQFTAALQLCDQALAAFKTVLARDPKHVEALNLRRQAEALRHKLLPFAEP